LEEIASPVIRAVLAAEDQRFLTHHGFDFVEMRKALSDILSERRTRGASTISMQVARTVFLWPERSLSRKVAEAYYTMLIEMLWSKRRILEMYLNTVDWGTGIIGVEAAARGYFQTSAHRITPSQGALLAAILPSPHRWSPTRPSRYIRERKRRIMKDMEKISLP
jgi:monofunctional biosynthetic peptidoglycan transglycosylase